MTVEDIIHIEALPETVWAVTEDVERWPEWTPTVTSVTRADGGPFGVGSVARIKQPAQPETAWTVTEFVPGERFAWTMERPGLRMAATHELSLHGEGTKNTLRVEASGVVATLFGPLLRPMIRKALVEENKGLKARCEERA